MAQPTKLYDIVWFVNGTPKEVPQRSKQYPFCKWWIKQNANRYTPGLLSIRPTGIFK